MIYATHNKSDAQHLPQKATVFILMGLSSLSILCWSFSAQAVLLALPSGEKQSLLWERSLIVYDSLSKQQTVIAEAAISGSPSKFAILIATPKVALIDYTTTRIWKRLRPYIRQKEAKVRSLKFKFYSFLWRYFEQSNQRERSEKKLIDVFKSRDTQIHIQERALHEWLIRRGLVLTPEQALSVKKAYREGFVITALLVKPPPRNKSQDVQETWTSTWLFSHEVKEPFYISLFPSRLKMKEVTHTKDLTITNSNVKWDSQIHVQENKGGSHSEKINQDSLNLPRDLQGINTKLKLAYLSDRPLRYEVDAMMSGPRKLIEAPSKVLGQIRNLSRLEISELNNSLNSQNWSFNRQGVLSSYELASSHGLSKIYGVEVEQNQVTPLPIKKVEQTYLLAIPFELLALLSSLILRIFIRNKNSF